MKKMTNEKAKECIDAIIGTWEICQNQKYPSAVDVEIDAEDIVALKMAITALEQEPCDDVCEWFEQYVDIATDIVELRFSDGTVKRAKRGLYMRDIEKSIRKMLIDQIANEKKQQSCDDAISRQAAIDAIYACYIGGKEAVDKAPYSDHYAEGIDEAVNAVYELPSVTVQEKTGRWIKNIDSYGNKHFTCPFCEHDIATKASTWEDNYCPNCGAKMGVGE